MAMATHSGLGPVGADRPLATWSECRRRAIGCTLPASGEQSRRMNDQTSPTEKTRLPEAPQSRPAAPSVPVAPAPSTAPTPGPAPEPVAAASPTPAPASSAGPTPAPARRRNTRAWLVLAGLFLVAV